jgi:hypothetical protein
MDHVMKRLAFSALLLVGAACALSGQAPGLAGLLPALGGWTAPSAAALYEPGNLYEYIDGAADNFLAYDFQQLAVQTYAGAGKQTVTVEIYRHADSTAAFGVYASEKPLQGHYLAIGTQGYYEAGVLNFLLGAYYIKLNGFDLGPGEQQTLTSFAQAIVARIGPQPGLPAIFATFPPGGRIANSERYIQSNFLGHPFLKSAFCADYTLQGKKSPFFVLVAADVAAARAMLAKWAELDKTAPAAVVQEGFLAIADPYQGPVQLCWRGARIWGLLAAPAGTLQTVLKNIADK